VTDAAAHDGLLRRELLDETNTGTTVWADSVYRSQANEAFMERHGFRSQVHHCKPKGRPIAPHIGRGNAGRSKMRAAIERVFDCQKGPMALAIRTIGIARAKAKIGLVKPHLQHPAAGLSATRLRVTARYPGQTYPGGACGAVTSRSTPTPPYTNLSSRRNSVHGSPQLAETRTMNCGV
jgi:hypothetical protein